MAVVPDFKILESHTVEEIDRLQDMCGFKTTWRLSKQRAMLAQREEMELNIVMKLEDNNFGIPITAKAAKLIEEDRGGADVYASLEHDREIHDPKEILWSNKETD